MKRLLRLTALALGLTLLLSACGHKNTEPERKDAATQTVPVEGITGLTLCDGDVTLRFEKDEEGSWIWHDDPTFPLEQSAMDELLALPAAASEALGEDLSAKDTTLHQGTALSRNVFWSSTYSDLRTENLITYSPSSQVKPMVTFGESLTQCRSVSTAAKALEDQGYRVVAGLNGDFFNTNNGLPIGLVITEGELRSSDGGYYGIGFRADGSAVLGKPGIKVTASLGYQLNGVDLIRTVTGVNKARVSTGGI